MALEKGNNEEQKTEQPEQAALSAEQTKLLLDEFSKMKSELEALRKNGAPQVAASGFTAEQFTELIRAVTKAAKEKPDSELDDIRQYIRAEDIDHDDYDPEGVRFCAYNTGYVIVDDVRSGRPVFTPYKNKIFFVYQATKRIKGGKYEELTTFSSYVSHSKKEQAWLREHSYYGILFFENARAAMNIDAKKAHRLAKFINMLNNMGQHQIVQYCRQYGVPINDSLKEMRIQVAYKMADLEQDKENESTSTTLRSTFEDKLMLETTPTK